MKAWIIAITSIALAASMASGAAAQGAKKTRKAAEPVCLNPLVCKPQPVKQIRKPKNERFMKSAS